MEIGTTFLGALRMAFAMFWEILWALIFGFSLSAVVQAVVDPNEPPLPGNVSTDQFIKFSEALVRGQKHGWKILKTVVKDKIREVV